MKELVADDEKLLDALVLEWMQEEPTGRPRTAQQLCQSRLDLVDELERRIHLMRVMNRLSIDADAPTGTMLPGTPLPTIRRELPQVPGFQIKREIGRGGMGIVYEAVQLKLNRPVALKVINGVGQSAPGLLKRLRDEAKALARLNHNHVIRVYDVIDQDDQVCLVLEYVDGRNLREREAGTAMDVRSAAQIALSVARTMSDVHRTGLLHRDLKPANLLQDKTGAIKISDFGVAKLLSAQSSNTVTTDGIGTPSYMAPEQAIGGNARIGEWTDVYGIGATLYDCLTGRPPFLGETPLATLAQLHQNEPIPPHMFNQRLPRDLETICLKCLEKDPRKRYPTAAALAADLERFLDGKPISARPLSPLELGCRWCKRNPDRAGLIAASLFGFIVLTGLIAWEIIRIHDATATANSQGKIISAALEKARNQEFYVTLGQIRDRSLRAPISWSYRNLEELEHVASIRPANDVAALRDLRSEYAKALAAFDLRKQRELLQGFDSYTMEFSPDGRVLAAGANADGDDGIQIALVDTATWQLSRIIAIPAWGEWIKDRPDGVRSLVFSPDGTELYVGCRSGWIRVVNLQSGEQTRSWHAHRHYVYRIRFASDGQSLISCSKDRAIKKWTLDGQLLVQIVRDCELKDFVIVNDDFAPHSTHIAVAADDPLWLEESTFEILKPALPDKQLSPAPCAAMAAFPHGGGWIKDCGLAYEVLDSRQHRHIRMFVDRKVPLRNLPEQHGLEISSDGRWFASADAESIKLWDLTGRDRVAEIPNPGQGRLVARFHPNQHTLVVSCDNRLAVYELSSDQIWGERIRQPSKLTHIGISPDGEHVAATRDFQFRKQLLFQGADARVLPSQEPAGNAYFDLTSNKDLFHFDHMLSQMHRTNIDGRDWGFFQDDGSSDVGIIKASADGQQVFFTSMLKVNPSAPHSETVGTLRMVDIRSQQCRTLLVNSESERLWRASKFLSLDVRARYVVCTSVDRSVRILDPQAADSKLEIGRLNLPTIADCVCLAPNESCCIAGNRQGELIVVDIPTGEIRQTIKAHEDIVKAVTFAGPDLFISGSRDRQLKFWQWKDGTLNEVFTFESLSGPVAELSASTDGKSVAVLLDDETAVRLLRVDLLRARMRSLELDW